MLPSALPTLSAPWWGLLRVQTSGPYPLRQVEPVSLAPQKPLTQVASQDNRSRGRPCGRARGCPLSLCPPCPGLLPARTRPWASQAKLPLSVPPLRAPLHVCLGASRLSPSAGLDPMSGGGQAEFGVRTRLPRRERPGAGNSPPDPSPLRLASHTLGMICRRSPSTLRPD